MHDVPAEQTHITVNKPRLPIEKILIPSDEEDVQKNEEEATAIIAELDKRFAGKEEKPPSTMPTPTSSLVGQRLRLLLMAKNYTFSSASVIGIPVKPTKRTTTPTSVNTLASKNHSTDLSSPTSAPELGHELTLTETKKIPTLLSTEPVMLARKEHSSSLDIQHCEQKLIEDDIISEDDDELFSDLNNRRADNEEKSAPNLSPSFGLVERELKQLAVAEIKINDGFSSSSVIEVSPRSSKLSPVSSTASFSSTATGYSSTEAETPPSTDNRSDLSGRASEQKHHSLKEIKELPTPLGVQSTMLDKKANNLPLDTKHRAPNRIEDENALMAKIDHFFNSRRNQFADPNNPKEIYRLAFAFLLHSLEPNWNQSLANLTVRQIFTLYRRPDLMLTFYLCLNDFNLQHNTMNQHHRPLGEAVDKKTLCRQLLLMHICIAR